MNPNIVVHIAEVNAPLSGGGLSLTGHMWFTITDEFGNKSSYGFAPKLEGDPYGPGKIYETDDIHYIDSPKKHDYEREITEDQYNKIKDFSENAKRQAEQHIGRWADYEGINNSCVDFAWGGMGAGGLVDTGGWQGNILPGNNQSDMNKYFMGRQSPYDKLWNNISDGVSEIFNSAMEWIQPRRDPLMLDLNGNGLETDGVAATGPILFDHDGDGIKTSTGWVSQNDGFLVLDRNGNGTIDNGTELFGDSTPIVAGGTAADGFAALTQEDTNHDAQVNNRDANWGNLRVWRDQNQNGTSEKGELFSLNEMGIASFNGKHSDPSENLTRSVGVLLIF
jgi:hypothetical protein